MKNLISVLSLVLFFAAPALALDSEIQSLNQDFGQSQAYPILILDKTDLQQYMKANKISNESKEIEQAIALKKYIAKQFKVKMTRADVFELLPYVNGEKPGASALPLFVDKIHYKYSMCVVVPSDELADPKDEIKRMLGADVKPELFKNADLNKLSSMMTTEELKLFSVYHELSHCLDPKFLPAVYGSEADPQQVHLAESFAEINALFLLFQRKGLSQLAEPRSLIRTAYSKYYGPYLAQGAPSPFIPNAAITAAGGSTYFFAPILAKAQSYIDQTPARIKGFTLAETTNLSTSLVVNFSLSKYGSQALRESFSMGREQTLAHYEKMVLKAPHIFGIAYKQLIEALAILDSVDENIANYSKP